MDAISTADGTLYIARDEAERGSEAPFYVAYHDEKREDRWGYVCANCDGLNIAMDPMGRIVCNDCPNRRKPTEWDAAHE